MTEQEKCLEARKKAEEIIDKNGWGDDIRFMMELRHALQHRLNEHSKKTENSSKNSTKS